MRVNAMDPSSSSSSAAIEPNSGVGAASAAGGSRQRSGGESPPPPPPPTAAAAEEGDWDVWDAVYGNDPAHEAPEQEAEPGDIRRARISVLALMKMTLDALSGGLDKRWGFVQGRVVGDAIVVMDSFRVPGFGIEDGSHLKYFDDYTSSTEQGGRSDVVVGWYHSHPGYSCRQSSYEILTLAVILRNEVLSLAIVIDSLRTVSTGKVEIGAFKIFKPIFVYKTSRLGSFEECSIFRKHDYALDITYFMSSLDSHLLNLLRNKYWVNSFSSSSLLANWDYAAELVFDLAEKLEEAEDQMDHTFLESSHLEKEQEESQLAKIARDSTEIAEEQVHRLILQTNLSKEGEGRITLIEGGDGATHFMGRKPDH